MSQVFSAILQVISSPFQLFLLICVSFLVWCNSNGRLLLLLPVLWGSYKKKSFPDQCPKVFASVSFLACALKSLTLCVARKWEFSIWVFSACSNWRDFLSVMCGGDLSGKNHWLYVHAFIPVFYVICLSIWVLFLLVGFFVVVVAAVFVLPVPWSFANDSFVVVS